MTEPAAWGSSAQQPAVAPEALTTTALACRDAERLTFTYTAADGARTERSVEPHRLVSLGRRWYLVGYDLDRGDWRIFRLDRLGGVRGTGARFGPRRFPAEDAATYVRQRLGGHQVTQRVEAVVEAPAEAVRRRIGRWARVEELPGGRCRVRMEADDLAWPAFALVATGAPFGEVSPPAMVEHLRAVAARYSAAVAGAPAAP
jgi:predicted DNA-binding transcriptional regulator YafY